MEQKVSKFINGSTVQKQTVPTYVEVPISHQHQSKKSNGQTLNHVEKQHHQKEDEKIKKLQRYWNIIKQKLEANKMDASDFKKYSRILQQSMNNKQVDRALGAIYGAMIGDALGAYCEFQHQISDKVADEAMQMNGGGTFGLEAGQFTDDSELASHLLTGLSKFDEHQKLQKSTSRLTCIIGLQYVDWMNSRPFDIGTTTRGGISTLHRYSRYLQNQATAKNPTVNPQFLKPMFEEIYKKNYNSMANGSLMRISPFAFFFALTGENTKNHKQFIKDEIRLTHPNEQLGDAGLCWVSILTNLIQRLDDEPATFLNIIKTHSQQYRQIKSWFKEAALEKEQAMSGTTNMGYAKIGFSYGLRILHYLAEGKEKKINDNLYWRWMRWIIKRAGDTDTNGAIAGGLLGSLVGFWGLPQKYIATTLKTVTDLRQLKINDDGIEPPANNKPKTKYHRPVRPQRYEPCNVFLQALDMVEKCQSYKKASKTYK